MSGREVVVELEKPDGDWVQVGAVSEDEPPGSMSSDDPVGRKVYVFGWHDDQPGVWVVVGGLGVENSAVRAITGRLDRRSDLSEPFVVGYNKSHRPRAYVRFSLREDA